MPLSEDQIRDRLAITTGWDIQGEAITRTFKFEDFVAAIAFVNKVAEVAEQMDHHPDILVTYNVVQISVFTHSEGGLTDKDFALAQKTNSLA